MKLLIHNHHPLSFTKTFHSSPPPKPHRVSFTTATATPITWSINAHCNCNCVFATRKSFDEVAYNTMIAASLKEKKVGEAFELLKAMIDKGMQPNLNSFNKVIYGLCTKMWWKRDAQEDFDKGLCPEFRYLYCMCMKKNLTRAMELLDHMRVRGLSPNQRTYTFLVENLFRSDKSEGFKLFFEMIVRGFSPSIDAYNMLLGIYCHFGRLEEAMGILRGMVSPNVVSYNNIIYWLCIIDQNKEIDVQDKEIDVEKALQLKAEMIEKGILPDADTYEWLISGLCWERRLSDAFDLFQEMLRGGLSPNEDTYNTLMTAYCVEGEFIKAFDLHDEMIKNGFLPDFVREFSPPLVTYNALIYLYCSSERVEEAVGILRRMAEMGLPPDVVSYSLVISGFRRIRDMRKAYGMVNEETFRLDEVTYSSLVQDLFDEVTYSSLMIAYLDVGEFYMVVQMNYLLEINRSFQRSVTCSVFFNGLDKKAWTTETKASVLNWIYNCCMDVPTYLTYDTLIENCSNNEFKSLVGLIKGLCMRGSKNAYDTMLQWNYKPDGAVYNLFILEHCKCGNVHEAYNMYTEMVRNGFASHMFSVLTLIKALSDKIMYNEQSWVIQNILRSCNLNDSSYVKYLLKLTSGKVKYMLFFMF